MNIQKTSFVICIMYSQTSEYWSGYHNAKNDNTSKLIQNALVYDTKEEAEIILKESVIPFGISENWNVSYAIDEYTPFIEE